MSLLSELEELQRCLEDTTDSESEKLPESAQPPSGDTCNETNELDSLLQSEFVSLTALPEAEDGKNRNESTEDSNLESTTASTSDSPVKPMDSEETSSSKAKKNSAKTKAAEEVGESSEPDVSRTEDLALPREEEDPGEGTNVEEGSFLKIEKVYSVSSPGEVRKSPGVKKRKLYTEPPLESDLVEVPKGRTSPETLLRLQNSNQIRKQKIGPLRKRKLLEDGPKKKKPRIVEVVVSPLGAKQPLLEQEAERLGKELLEARVVLKRLNIPIPEHLQTDTALQSTLEEVSKEIQGSLISIPSQKEKKVKAKPKTLSKQPPFPKKIKESKPAQKKPQAKVKNSAKPLKVALGSAPNKTVVAPKLQVRPLKNVAKKKKAEVERIKPKLKKISVSNSEVKSKKVKKKLQSPPQGKVKISSVSGENKKVKKNSVTSVSAGKKMIAKDTGEVATKIASKKKKKNAIVPKSKKPVKEPEVKAMKLGSPLGRSRKSPASKTKDEDMDEWQVEYLIDEDVDLSAMSKVSSSDDKRPSLSEMVPECDSSTDKRDMTAERKMLEMKKAIRDLERIADRSMLRLKAEQRQVVYLTNKLRYYEGEKHISMLRRILKDAEPGPRQNSDAVFIVDLLLSYCPEEESSESSSAK